MPEVKENPDYQLVMKFLQLIKPGDMDEQSANQLMMIGQRIQNGGALSDREREMFQGVVGAMPMEGSMGAMPSTRSEPAMPNTGMTDAKKRMIQEEAFQKMIMDQNEMQQQAMDQRMMNDINAGSLAPMTSPRPMARPMRQETIMAEVNVENMEENADLFIEKMGFPHDAEGLEMSDDQLVNFLLLCHQMQYGMMHDDEEEMYEEEVMMPHGNDVKVKVMKLDGGNVHEMMNELLGG